MPFVQRPDRKEIRIRRTLTSVTHAVLVAFIFTVSTDAQVSWKRDFEEAKELAVRENKVIFADFWASWCGPCLRMDKEVWNQYLIMGLSRKFICLRIDVDKSELDRYYDVNAFPAMLVLDGFGNKLFHITGYRSAEQMALVMGALPEDFSNVYEILQRVEEEPDNIDLVILLADRYRKHGMHSISNKFYKQASKSKEVKKDPISLDKVKTFMSVNYLFLDEAKKARKGFEKCLKKFPESEYRPLHLFGLVKSNVQLNKREAAREYFEVLKGEFPDDRHTKWASELLTSES